MRAVRRRTGVEAKRAPSRKAEENRRRNDGGCICCTVFSVIISGVYPCVSVDVAADFLLSENTGFVFSAGVLNSLPLNAGNL